MALFDLDKITTKLNLDEAFIGAEVNNTTVYISKNQDGWFVSDRGETAAFLESVGRNLYADNPWRTEVITWCQERGLILYDEDEEGSLPATIGTEVRDEAELAQAIENVSQVIVKINQAHRR